MTVTTVVSLALVDKSEIIEAEDGVTEVVESKSGLKIAIVIITIIYCQCYLDNKLLARVLLVKSFWGSFEFPKVL